MKQNMKAMRLIVVLLYISHLVFMASADSLGVAPTISNLKAVQRTNSYYVDITYDLVDPDSTNGVFISAVASSDNGTNYVILMSALTGDVGLVKPGTGKSIVWNAWTDWPNHYTTNARVRLIADDFPSSVASGKIATFTNNISLPATNFSNTNFVWIPPGSFNMQGTLVWIPKGFWMSKFEVTQTEYFSVMSTNPSIFTNNLSRPVDNVSWTNAYDYCIKRTVNEHNAGTLKTNWSCLLPTEAQWEYASRCGATNTYFFGEDPSGSRLDFFGWHDSNSTNSTHSVGTLYPNSWGLYDMYGNVLEWCADWYAPLPIGSVTDGIGGMAGVGTSRVLRGGSWNSDGPMCSSSFRYMAPPNTRNKTFGFRVILYQLFDDVGPSPK